MMWWLIVALVLGIDQHFFYGVLVGCCAFFHTLYCDKRPLRALFFLSVLSLFYIYGELSSRSFDSRFCSVSSLETPHATLRGFVAGYPRTSRGKTRFVFRTSVAGRKVNLLANVRGFSIDYGDSIALTGTFFASRRTSQDREAENLRYWRSLDISGVFTVGADGVRRLEGSGGSILSRNVFWPIHKRLRNDLVRYLGNRSGVPLALLLGEKDRLGRNTKSMLSSLGISHLFALSGLHLGLVLGLILALFRLLRLESHVLVLLTLTLYVAAVGDVISLHRAYVMVLLGALTKRLYRPLSPINILRSALLLMFLWKPGSLYSVGCQFSFLATSAVLICIDRIDFSSGKRIRDRICRYIGSSMWVSCHAQLFIAPLALVYFGQISLATPVTTLLFLPLVFMLLVTTGACSLIGTIHVSASPIIYFALGKCTDVFMLILRFFDDVAMSPVVVKAPHLISFYGGLFLFMRQGRFWVRLSGITLMGIAFLIPNR